MKRHRQIVKNLADKYEKEIEDLFNEIKTDQEQWGKGNSGN